MKLKEEEKRKEKKKSMSTFVNQKVGTKSLLKLLLVLVGVSDCSSKKCSHSLARSWVNCSECSLWFHCICVGLTFKLASSESFVCNNCK